MNIEDFEKLEYYEKQKIVDKITTVNLIKKGTIAALVIIMLSLGGCPQYNVWRQGLVGKAELARAEQNRQITINEAMAKEQSAKHWANAEVERAKGAAKANMIVADSLGGPEGYLRWLFIEKLDEIKNGQIIYLPTEAGVPILEAGRTVTN